MELFDLIKSPTFWFSTVIVGIIVSIIGNFLTDKLKIIWAHFSITQKIKNEEQERIFDQEVQTLLDNPAKVTDLKIEAIYSLLSNISKLLLYLILMNIVSALQVGIPFVNLVLYLIVDIYAVTDAISMIRKDQNTRSLLNEYKRKQVNI